MPTTIEQDTSWMLDEVLRVPHVQHAILVTSDGLLHSSRGDLPRDRADSLAAAVSGLVSLAKNCERTLRSDAGQWWQGLDEYPWGYLMRVAAARNTVLAVVAGREVDMETLSVRVQQVVQRLGQAMAAAPRAGQ
ncbi:roadblock/LC7 domain-containing protein [Actinophytocola sp.]|jgi:predicted regulator of Ras-like GTPase activity (Roadblock/LC7/MglB family)|uniref:roadblock/LC7 domain-containing protein n=1 Tax=Actinophytocola sp. TaxID=1872138 RepID=UPI002D5BBAB8|nr:roadblock/LC7 domain-containing protein [Actinophytocola sp.]HYQ63457.1 roadblock/LC7 domain-containing protein [Actinophytocola sp.]